jgi:hypothetical protein
MATKSPVKDARLMWANAPRQKRTLLPPGQRTSVLVHNLIYDIRNVFHVSVLHNYKVKEIQALKSFFHLTFSVNTHNASINSKTPALR